MWSQIRKTMLAIFRRSPRELSPLELVYKQNLEVTRTFLTLTELGEPPSDWQTPREIQEQRDAAVREGRL